MDLSKIPTVELTTVLDIAINSGDQEFINKVAIEITRRIYVPNNKISMDEFLSQWGYQPLEESKEDIKTLKKFFKKGGIK